VSEDIRESYAVRSGPIGGSSEIHEDSGRGAMALFSAQGSSYRYITKNRVTDSHWCTGSVQVSRDANGRGVLDLQFDGPGARIVFFGVE
jgi:hypothetical protein